MLKEIIFEIFSLGNFSSRLEREWNFAQQISLNICICCGNIKESSGRGWFLSQLELLSQKSTQMYLEEKKLVTTDCPLALLLIGRDKHKNNFGG